MSLTQRQKSYIKKNYPGKSALKLAEDINTSQDEINAFIEKESLDIDPGRTRIFKLIAVSLPFLIFILLEIVLRISGYKSETNLFTEMTVYDTEYLYPNRTFTARYFFYTRTLPNPPQDLFLKEKPENGFRVFLMGGSTAAAYPYGYNASAARTVRDALTDMLPNHKVEVINVATSAINTYTLYDQVDEILDHHPDLILIYSGHNEYYGALGVGSNEHIGSYPGFVRVYLKLQRLKTFLLLRDGMASVSRWIAQKTASDMADPSGTLMERIVREQSIPLDSELYEAGEHQFKSNLQAIISKFSDQDIPVMIGSLASNLKHQAPFISEPIEDHPAAVDVFEDGLEEYNREEYGKAFELLTYARDLDLLKFRAPSSFNNIIREITDETPATYVPVEENFRQQSKGGIIGEEVMLEHLHPNFDGYYLLAMSFITEMINRDLPGIQLNVQNLRNPGSYLDRMFLSNFDKRIAYHRIRTLKSGWPFNMSGQSRSYTTDYKPVNKADSLAFELVHRSLAWDRAKVELGTHYTSENQPERALLEFMGLIRNQPWNDSPYIFAARIFLDRNDFDNAYPLLSTAYDINPDDPFTNKMLGAIEVDRQNLERGIALLTRAIELSPDDAQALFNLSGAYGLKGDFENAQLILDKLIEINPNFPGIRSWKMQLDQITGQQQD